MNTEQRSASTVTEPERQAEIAQRLTDLARQLRGLLTDFPSDAVWNRPARLLQLADDCKAEAEEFDESPEPRAETLAAWDDIVRILKQGRQKSPA